MAKQFTVFSFIRDIKKQLINMQRNIILLSLLFFIMLCFSCDYERWHPHFDGSIAIDGQCICRFDSDQDNKKYIETTMKESENKIQNTIDDSISVVVYEDGGIVNKDEWEIICDEYPPEKLLK